MAHVWNWIVNFMGLNYGQNSFSTHMYNFWSGFGGDITEFALVGTLLAIYRNHVKSFKSINSSLKDIVRRDLNVPKPLLQNLPLHKDEGDKKDKDEQKKPD